MSRISVIIKSSVVKEGAPVNFYTICFGRSEHYLTDAGWMMAAMSRLGVGNELTGRYEATDVSHDGPLAYAEKLEATLNCFDVRLDNHLPGVETPGRYVFERESVGTHGITEHEAGAADLHMYVDRSEGWPLGCVLAGGWCNYAVHPLGYAFSRLEADAIAGGVSEADVGRFAGLAAFQAEVLGDFPYRVPSRLDLDYVFEGLGGFTPRDPNYVYCVPGRVNDACAALVRGVTPKRVEAVRKAVTDHFAKIAS